MGRRALKRHVQQELPKTRKRDKNGQFRGGKRPGAGRPKRPISQGRASEPHKVRPRVRSSEPVHVVMRATQHVGSLRTHEVFRAIREATLAAVRNHEETFHVVHISIQRSHIHLVIEASDRESLWRGMKAFGISAAKHINALVGARSGARRRGSVFTDRYHATTLSTPRQVRNCLSYVLNNWRHHGDDAQRLARPWKIDPYSSALAFDGWKEREASGFFYRVPEGYDGVVVWRPKSWLLRVGWRRHGLVSVFEVPGAGAGAE